MPLRDHFHAPLDDESQWEGFHGGWPMMIVADLVHKLPPRYVAAPRVHSGASVEIDVATFEKNVSSVSTSIGEQTNANVAAAVWAPPQPTLTIETDLPALDEYEVRVYDAKRARRLVAAIEIVSPANKDRPEHRQAFISKCLALLENRVFVAIVDLVTTRNFNFYTELLASIEQTDPSFGADPPALYVAATRARRSGDAWLLDNWAHPLKLGQPLPTLPLWLADDFAVPLDLEESYQETCRILRIA